MARRLPSRRSLSMGDENMSRRASVEPSNPNVFSDEYAVDPAEALASPSPTGSIDGQPERLNLGRRDNVQNAPLTGLNRLSTSHRPFPAESSADPHRAVSTSSRSMADSRRTLSTSSRFSMPRAQSPYRGPTAPSQPYGLYPQATRASSIASESTIRPLERPFVPQGGPEHPYSMYPQNTVPEEGDNPETNIPLGFPGLGQSYQPGTNSSGDDVGDIVGTDGHVEQLPPYSRYADNVIAKGDMARIDPQRTSTSEDSTTAAATQPPTSSASDVELTAVRSGPGAEETARKEGMSEKKKRRRTCCGLPVWTMVILVAVVVLAAVLGGVVGGIVGTKKGTDRALASGATTTVWLDADPAQTGPSTPACPTGHFTIPLNQTQEIDACVVDGTYAHIWDCGNFPKLGVDVFESGNGGPPLSVVFDDYSVRPQLFKYGPQPPDFNGTAFTLQPYKDKEDDELGVALFFSVLFDKLSILHSDELTPSGPKKRSVPASHLEQRGDDIWTADYLSVGDQPWYCFWNSTISEFWVFLDQDTTDDDDSSASGSAATITSGDPTATSAAVYGSSPSSPMHITQSTTLDPSMTTPYPSEPTEDGHMGDPKIRRQAPVGSSYFPKLVKMVEKRKPENNIQPYCQQMQVLNNWQIVPIPEIPTICIEESEYTPAASTGGSRMAIRKRGPDTVQQMGSNCICEWFSIDV
ncbi:uncharacterized protein Z518_06637 [Rhinocladiella mackenziei CBS 650.93]|uniref:DUF7820 domain-containing protein n=1 Tax=Rhinocladiella mackenziei CBS 650.93 TaxID=1442369 RepID=A0A0D2FM94_9EURO|nr:uncharacterized protein Z518_06637 [Rhinocladiella mackenziei CBS 650.93]KIX03087.1 hypothetical protein Z518_06637 [Rhinocladiella mackenziei CBS 650.93]